MSNTTPQKEEVRVALQKITQSSGFRQSELYCHILTFLVESYWEKTNVKESILEVELQEKLNIQPYDGKIRGYMFNLRKKLDQYYQAEGSDETIKLKVEKGQYNLSVEVIKHNKQHNTNNTYLIGAIVMLVIAFVITQLYLSGNISWESNYCWNSYFRKDMQTTCFVGDHYMLRSKMDNGLEYALHIDGVYNDRSYDTVAVKYNLNKLDYVRPTFTFVTKMGPLAVSDLTYWFAQHHKKPQIRMESDLMPDDLTRENILYVGPYKTLTGLQDVFLKDSKIFKLENGRITDIEKNKVYHNHLKDNIRHDYVMVSFNKLSDHGNDILFFASDHDIGVISAVSNFTNPQWLANFYKNLPSKSTHFNALFLVKGIERTDLQCELVRLEVVE
ncbi:hypothetical protein EYV94_19930 [Puteibacter caeruleilacunae]|nr:hypothetical protein EYV94_19930 [Puteibacter caeruleilacunae]